MSDEVISVWLERLAPYMTPDLEDYLSACASMFFQVEEYAGLFDEENGWQVLLDPLLCPAPALPYLGQYIGERIPQGTSEADMRQWILDQPNMRRGTLISIVSAAQRSLTGTRMVSVRERSGAAANPEDYLAVRTYTTETPDPAQVYADLIKVVPADIDLDYAAATGQTWGDVQTAYATWQAVADANATWDKVAGALAGYTTVNRPRPIP